MKVNLMHGAGGEVMGELLRTLTAFSHNNAGGVGLESLDDGAIIPINGSNIVLTTDSHVVRPLFFPGGDIGRLSVCGTVNDLAVMGARPIALTSAMIIEEGFSVDDLARIVASMDQALGEAGASIVTGDTKVVERGSLDGIIINTAGIGIALRPVRDSTLQEGDLIIASGTLGDHGISILSYREGFEFGETLHSDVAPVWPIIERALAAGDIHAMKDPTRGGFAAAINEMAHKSGVGILLDEEKVPIRRSIRSAADILGIDPLQVANEGKVIMGIAPEDADAILSAIRSHPTGADAAIIGEVISGSRVVMQTSIGGERFIEPPLGDPVPRVC
ncbi:hydrogenase expression/formation protein HypE [Methanocalculus taiwanensis]|uniref:Hydrogenase expression/formation protein HypE n=1 Tax=Methanocalculus taiwanensis TaxID=106207 RepID=A0ABD4TMV2_9EURY|nr:hydrogenase expression/formation protein HypE [Methanocalculus taiwanensis]MCQ1538942.1 hydrogenase expression/formation protein HypE [Methanocalculus taiwanensis]